MSDAPLDAPSAVTTANFVLQARALVPVHTIFQCRAGTDHGALSQFEKAWRSEDLRWTIDDGDEPSNESPGPAIPNKQVVSVVRASPIGADDSNEHAQDGRSFNVEAVGFVVATQTLWLDAVDLGMAKKVGATFAGMRAHPWTIGDHTFIRHVPRSALLSVEPVV